MARSAAAAPASDATGEQLTAEEQALLDADQANVDVGTQDDAAQTGDDDGQAAAADGAGADSVAGAATPQRQQMVPYAALHQEREQRKAAEAAAAAEKQRSQTLEERTNLLLQRFQQAQQPPQPGTPGAPPPLPAIPALETDPVGHVLGRIQRQDALMQEVVQALVGQTRQGEVQATTTAIQRRTAALEQEFAARTPDYDAATKFLVDSRHKELIAAGWNDPGERQQMLGNEATGVAQRAMQMGRNPAEVFYEIAKAKGFAAQAAAAAGDAGDANGEAPATAPNGAAQIQAIARGQQQSRSVGRGTAPPPLTATTLLALSDDEFAKMMETAEGKGLLGT